jgi:hypothetical protein
VSSRQDGPDGIEQSRAADRFLDPRPFPSAPPALLVRAALALRQGLLRLADALFPAELAIFERALGATDTILIGLAARLGITDLLEAGPLSATEIAGRLGLNADRTHRFLRALATRGVYSLARDGRFSNNRLSQALRSASPSRTRAWAMYVSSRANLTAFGAIGRAVRDGASPFEAEHGVSVWDWFEANPDEREHFAHAMMGITFFDAPVVAAIYPFHEVQRVCDVGGGRGSLLSELLIRHPHLRAVLCDGAGVLDSARSLLEARGVAGRVELVPTNFFEAVPPGADAYLMKNILHDWDDERSLVILRNIRRAIGERGRLIIVESLLDPNGSDGVAPLADLHMMLVCDGGRERSREEFASLFSRAGFRLSRVFPYPTTSVIEAEPV